MTRVLLIYPYFKPRRSRSIFRFPPLGICYVAASLQAAGYEVDVLDCTFTKLDTALAQAAHTKADVVGIYSMITMQEESITFARHLRPHTKLLVAGGPLPSCDPKAFLDDFDVVVVGGSVLWSSSSTRTKRGAKKPLSRGLHTEAARMARA